MTNLTSPSRIARASLRPAYIERKTLHQRRDRWLNRDRALASDAARTLREPPDPALDLTIVVPFFNTGRALLGQTLTGIRDKLTQAGITHEVIAVDDGGSDDSYLAVADLDDPHVQLLRMPQNQGKGGALLHGFAAARADWIGFIDADGDISPDHLARYLAIAVASDSDMVVADKTLRESVNAVEASRAVTSRVMHMVNGRLLRLPLTDTQTGAKIFRREFLSNAVPLARERGFALDVELFVLARILGYRRILAMPVSIDRQGGSTVSKKTVLKTGLGVLRIWGRDTLGIYAAEARDWGDHAAVGIQFADVTSGYEATPEQGAGGRRSGTDRRARAVPGGSGPAPMALT